MGAANPKEAKDQKDFSPWRKQVTNVAPEGITYQRGTRNNYEQQISSEGDHQSLTSTRTPGQDSINISESKGLTQINSPSNKNSPSGITSKSSPSDGVVEKNASTSSNHLDNTKTDVNQHDVDTPIVDGGETQRATSSKSKTTPEKEHQKNSPSTLPGTSQSSNALCSSHHTDDIRKTSNQYIDKKVPVVFTWTHGGQNVFLVGSFNNWTEKLPMVRSLSLIHI